ncbi:unnamed protein product, partial [Scytosiphon promiscuus]
MGHRDAPSLRHTRPPPGIFCKSYECHSMACLDRPGLEFGDKIIMPQKAFREASYHYCRTAHALRLKLPLLFKLVNTTESTRRVIGTAGTAPYQFCGVLEFSAPDDQVFLPYWLMQNLLLSEGARVELRSLIRPPSGSFVRFKPHDQMFLAVAARQGPKVLMEEALRRYSILFEGATILVQHEGENYYLDVVELRTFASGPTATISDVGNTDGERASSGIPAETPCPARIRKDDEKRGHCKARDSCDEGTSNGAVNGCNGGRNGRDLQPPSEGRRVRLVSLLGDLDLEVEFCDAQSAPTASASAPPQHDATEQQRADCRHYQDRRHLAKTVVDRGNNLLGGARVPPVERIPAGTPAPPPTSSSVVAGPPSCLNASNNPPFGSSGPLAQSTGRDNNRRGGSELALPLPAPARAKKSCEDRPSSAVFGSGLEPAQSMARVQGHRRPNPPMWKASSKTSKFRAFCGKGMSLVRKTPMPDQAIGGEAGAPIGPTPAAPAASSAALNETTRATSVACDEVIISRDGSAGAWSCSETSGGRKEQMAKVWGSSSGGPRLSRIKDGSSTCEKTAFSGRKSDEGIVAGEALDECTPGAGSPAAAASTGGVGANTSSADSTTVPNGQRLREKVGDNTNVEDLAETIAEEVLCGCCGKLVTAANQLLHELRCSASSIVPPARQSPPPCRPSAGVDQKQEKSLGTSSRSHQARANKQLHARRAASSSSTVASTSEPMVTPCMYCGLSFRTASAVGEHEVACAARTERCDRCFGLVSRREAESHRRPGGGCDAAIATAQAAEARSVVDVGVRDRGRGGTRRGEANGGRFDALLAEAVRSSKAASAALADARKKNDARMTKAASDRLEDPCVGPHLGRECADDDKGDYGGLFGDAVESSGRKHASESDVQQPQLPTPECGTGSSKISARENRPSQAGDGAATEEQDGKTVEPEKEEEPGREAEKAAILTLERRAWRCPRCTLDNPRESEECDACEWTRKSAVNDLQCNRGSMEHPSSFSEHATPAPTVASLEDREGRGPDQRAARTRAERVEPGDNGLMPAGAVTAAAAGGGATSGRVLPQSSTSFIPAKLRTPLVTADDGSPPPSGGTLGSIVAGVSRNTGMRAGALPALVAAAKGGFSRGGHGSTSFPAADGSDVGGAADDSRRIHGQGLHRPSPRRRTPTLRTVHRQQQRQQITPTMNMARRETGQRRRENGTRRREGRRAPPTTTITAGPPRRLGGVHRSRRLRYPASSSLTPRDERPSSARSGTAVAWTEPRAPPFSSPPAPIAAAGRAQEAAANRDRSPMRHHEDALRLSSSSAPPARGSVQRGGSGISSGTSG